MKKNYDIYDDDFNELSGNYKDLVNQPTMGDAFAEAFSKAGSNPTPGPQGAIANAILNGMGAGFKGSENMIRQQKLEPLYKMVAENTARAAEIRAQVQEAKQNELAFKKFADIATPTVAAFAEQVKNGDPRSNITFTGLIDQLSRTVPQFNKYTADHWNTAKGFGLLLNKETGEHLKISADEIMQAIAPRAKEIYGDRWFEKFDGLSAGLAKDAAYGFNMQRQEDALGLEGKRADIANKYSQVDYHNAQTGKIENQVANPKPSPEEYKANSKVAEFNRTLIKDEIKPKLVANEALLDAYESLGQIAKESPDIIGSDLKTKADRIWGQAWGLDPNIDYANLKAIEFEKMLKPILGAQLGEKEGERVLSKFASIGNNKIALEKFLKNEIPKVTEDIVEAKQLINAFNQVQHANLYDNAIYENKDQAIEQYKQERENKKLKNNDNDMVRVISPSGEIGMIPKNSLQAAQEEGFKLEQ
jgi:hypothetical protein